MTVFQPMPDLSEEQYAALKADIETNGILVPIIVDQHDRILDGHNRSRIGTELGIHVPRETHAVADDDEASDLAVTLNCARRHLTREQTREVVAQEILRRPDDSDRAIARRVGCSPSTVGTVRRGGQPSKLDTSAMSREAAELLTKEIRGHLTAARENVAALVMTGAQGGVPVSELVVALTRAIRTHQSQVEREVFDVFRVGVYDPVMNALLDDSPIMPALAMTPEESAEIVHAIESISDSLRS